MTVTFVQTIQLDIEFENDQKFGQYLTPKQTHKIILQWRFHSNRRVVKQTWTVQTSLVRDLRGRVGHRWSRPCTHQRGQSTHSTHTSFINHNHSSRQITTTTLHLSFLPYLLHQPQPQSMPNNTHYNITLATANISTCSAEHNCTSRKTGNKWLYDTF